MADRVSKADDKTKREIALALVDRITIETIREDDDVRTTARVRYAFDPPPLERYTQRHHLRYPEMLSPVSPVVNYLTCACRPYMSTVPVFHIKRRRNHPENHLRAVRKKPCLGGSPVLMASASNAVKNCAAIILAVA